MSKYTRKKQNFWSVVPTREKRVVNAEGKVNGGAQGFAIKHFAFDSIIKR